MKINTISEDIVFEPENEYDVFLIGTLQQKFHATIVNFESDSHDKFTKVQNMKCHKDVLLYYLEYSRKESTNSNFKKY